MKPGLNPDDSEDQEPLVIDGLVPATSEKPGNEDGDSIQVEHDVVDELVIQPVGFPIRLSGSDQSGDSIIIDDKRLFEKYCVEQWNMMTVDVGTFLFDQYIIPDFAYEVVAVIPGPGKITSRTRIHLRNKKANELLTPLRPVTFDDIVGQEEAKTKARLILKYIENQDVLPKEWAPRNILFHGPPGTGKTMMARAIAHEANAGFLARNGTTLIGLHVGDGAKKIHDLYRSAASTAPCIVFIDELDAIGLSRSFQHVRGDVIEVATALLAELDGMQENDGVITIACTNQVELLDPALRSRFEEEIEFTLPNFKERVKLLELYFKSTGLDLDIDYEKVSSRIPRWTGRDIKEKLVKNIVHECVLAGKRVVTTAMVLRQAAKVTGERRVRRADTLSI